MVTPTAGCGALLVAALSAVGMTAPLSGREQSADAAAIHALEDRIEAAARGDDADALSGLWAADYLFVNPAGERLTRSDCVRMLRSGQLRYDRYTRDEEIIRMYGPRPSCSTGPPLPRCAARSILPASAASPT